MPLSKSADAPPGGAPVAGRDEGTFNLESALKAVMVFATRGRLAGVENAPGQPIEWMVQCGVETVTFSGGFGFVALPKPFPKCFKCALSNGQDTTVQVYAGGTTLSLLRLKSNGASDIVKWVALGY